MIVSNPPQEAGIRATSPVGVSLPSGAIVAWSSGTLPGGWVECDGTNGTDDYRGRFLRGKDVGEIVGATGGADDHKHVGGAHTHTAGSLTGSHTHTDNLNMPTHGHGAGTAAVASHCHDFATTCSHTHGQSAITLDDHHHLYDFRMPAHTHAIAVHTGTTDEYAQDCTEDYPGDVQFAEFQITIPDVTCDSSVEDIQGDIEDCTSATFSGTLDNCVASYSGTTCAESDTLVGTPDNYGPAALTGEVTSCSTSLSGLSASGGAVDTTEDDHRPPWTNVYWIMKL